MLVKRLDTNDSSGTSVGCPSQILKISSYTERLFTSQFVANNWLLLILKLEFDLGSE